ncbi:hypothetical protein ACFSVJ_06680 [Prauserella oleivorans]
MRLTPPDEYFHHQVSLPHSMVGSSDPSWRERYWISIQDVENQDTVLTCGIGQYPNQDVQEAFVVVSEGGRQRNLRLARELGPRSDVMKVGPLTIDVVRPYEDLHLVLDDNPSGMTFDLHWNGTMEPVLEGRHFQVSRSRATYDAIRYVQVGRASGTLRTPDGERQVRPEHWWGERDHSWGTRPLPRTQGTPRATPGMADAHVLSDPDAGLRPALLPLRGRARPSRAPVGRGLAPARPSRRRGVSRRGHHRGGPRSQLGGRRTGRDPVRRHDRGHAGRRPQARLRDPGAARPGLPRGGGYEGWNGWFQGHWKGEESLEHEIWDLTDDSQFYRYAKASSDHLIEVRHGGKTGYGVMEYMVLPGYSKYPDAIPPRPARADR